jgi:enterochelin esterase-like enzyme
VDIAAAQQLLDMYGKLDRIEVFLGSGENAERAERLIKDSLPSGYDIETPGAHTWMVWRRNLSNFAPLLFMNK